MALKVFEVTRCWKHPRGRYLVAAKSKTEASRILGCSVYHLNQYAYILKSDTPEYILAMKSPRTVFKQNDEICVYTPIS
jgi:hypothetical protein